ncbi:MULTISPECIES: cytochrome P450 [Actinokineospora]|uniref:Cytochrome P450 n=1 Tax=Actinokineospora fastidiosa TaxID=1816 RepID=A0A918GEH0_9PSEU|nr:MULTISPECIES: cytochrome P450 [Actinokineospora]UVS80019.1 Cytochrome P450-SU2 [Actinokineospora sp. UTMC 2448]GGS32527.1 cytochrome P450 [Actinokineospora fastidiosa]
MTGATTTPDRAEPSFRLPLPRPFFDRDTPFDPPAALREQAAKGPVAEVTNGEGTKVWLVSGHAEARAVLSDTRFSSDLRRLVSRMDGLTDEQRDDLMSEESSAGSFISMDPPDHTRYRKLLTGQFTVRRMRMLEPRIAEIVDERIDAMLAGGTSADLVAEFALPVPSLVICELLGVPYEQRAEFQECAAKLLALDVPISEVLTLRDRLQDFMRGLVLQKRRAPGDDLISGLITNSDLNDNELVNIANLLLIAGHETTANMLGLGTFALLEHPEELAALRANPELADRAVEELLRHLSIIHAGPSRVATEDIEVGGVLIPEGSTVMISVPAANRDPGHWADPAALDVARERGPHLAFGHGVHQCLGQQLARIEMTIGLTKLLARLPGLRLAVPAEDVPLRTDMAIYGVHALPVAWDAP